MADDLGLSLLATGPVAPLADASAVRARGDQRRRRLAVVAGVASVSAALLVGGLVLTLQKATSSSLQVASPPAPNAAPALAGALLQPSDVRAVRGGSWVLDGPWQPYRHAMLTVCTGGTAVSGSAALGTGMLDLHGGVVRTQVLRMPSAEAATQALAGLAAQATGCPLRPGGAAADPRGQDGPAQTAVTALDGGAVEVDQHSAVCDRRCHEQVDRFVFVAVGDLVGVADGRSTAELQAYAARLRARLAACAAGCPAPEHLHPYGFPDAVAPTEGAQVWAVAVGGYLPDGSRAGVDAARQRAQLVGYVPTSLPASCVPGSELPGVTLPTGARLEQLLFASQTAARAFVDAYRTVSGGTPGPPSRVTVRCLS